jgi:tetratricopeptide (TPR) repeat protein
MNPIAKQSAIDQAQELMYDAWDAPDKRTRVRLARKALEISLDCADAYVLLALDSAKSHAEAMALYKAGVEAGERAIGKAMFKKEAGRFWGILETRPYMRALVGLANSLREVGKLDEAVEHYRDMIMLNPNDNQGIRYILLPCLVVLDRVKEAKDLLKQYNDDASAAWAYSRALLNYRKSGDSPVADKSLAAAIKQNGHVVKYLLGYRKVPKRLPDYYGFGDENEAIIYAHGNMAAWEASPGAVEWLNARIGKSEA